MTVPRIFRYGERAVYVDLDLVHAPDRAVRTHRFARMLRQRFPNADVVVGGGVLVVMGNVHVEEVALVLGEPVAEHQEGLSQKTHVVPIVFDGPDFDDVSQSLGLSRDAIVEMMVNTSFLVELLGFLPGFGYLAPNDRPFVVPRRKTPRPRVPAQSFGIAGGFAGIYPFSSPGGWHLLGRSVGPLLFDSNRDEPFLFAAGDDVRFVAADVAAEGFVAPLVKMDPSDKPAFVVEFAPACATIQDGGRSGQLHRGMPPSGPLDPEVFVRANSAVGNERNEAAIEVPLGRFVLRAQRELVVSVDGDKPMHLASGERFEVPENDQAVRYLAFRGGVDVPEVLHSRATLLVARLGGLAGRPLRKGDVLGLADRAVAALGATSHEFIENDDESKIVIDPGPHLDRFPPNAIDVLLSSTYSISTLGDRVGVRLDGPKIPRDGGDSALPVPMMRGAMQIATDGTPIVFGPDHPTTGGYPVLAVVRRASWGRLARSRPGKTIRFVLGN